MEFGKVPTSELDKIDLSLPIDDPRTWVALNKAVGRRSIVRIGVGAPVWGVKDWIGRVYPFDAQPKDFLFHYAQQFNSIELNTTHYRTPDQETVRKWRESTPDGFKFNVKFLQEISHRALSSKSQIAREFITRTMELGDRLGISFLQLPPTFSPSDLPQLKNFLESLPQGFPIAVEIRHPAFFEDHRLTTPYYDLLARYCAHVVITDVAGRRDVLHTSLPTSRFLLRFIGNNLHRTDDTRIADWVARLKTWINLGLEQVEFFVHQPDDVNVPDLITRLIDQLNENTGLELQNWKPRNAGTQLGFFE